MIHFSQVIDDLLDPFLRRRAGISMSLVSAWSEIVGSNIARCCRPEKIIWPKRTSIERQDISSDVSGTLIIACEGSHALFLMHDQSKIIRNVNIFFGFCAIKRIRFLQRSMSIVNQAPSVSIPALEKDDCEKIDKMTEGIKDEQLKRALIRFGHAVVGCSYL
ncbi:DciA family protein [Candidatus Liberibacter asiaticus]